MSLDSIPPELVREIIHFMLSSDPPRPITPKEPRCFSIKPSFILDALSLTSRTYRALALEAWFRNLYLESPDDVRFLRYHLPELKAKWTRILHCVQAYDMIIPPWHLSGFGKLSAVRLDWPAPTAMPCYPGHHGWISLPFLNISSNVEQLDLHGLVEPSPAAFYGIPNTFRNLKVLKIQQSTIWCGSCNTCCKVRLKDWAFTKAVYEGGYGLLIAYARILSRLKDLETVIITMPNYGLGCTTLGHATPDPDTNPIQNLWSGECDKCMQRLHMNNAFQGKWAERKRALIYGNKVRPPKLRRVEWRFWKANSDERAASLVSFMDFEAMNNEVRS